MTSPYKLAAEDLASGLARAEGENVDANMYGQALIWQVLQHYQSMGRTREDIEREVNFTLEELGEDGIFHVCRH